MPDIASNPSEDTCDVLVVGGGPAGSTISTLLAQRGEKVVLVEKDHHPRFHIGESLLPLNLPLLDELGVGEQVEKIGMYKYSAEFVSPYHDKKVTFDFGKAWDKRYPYSYQVRRADFDNILIKNAAVKGATVIEGCRVTDVAFPPEGGVTVTGRDDDGQTRQWRAKFLVDASGRDTLMANRLQLKQRNSKHNSAAMFGHFTGAMRPTGKAEGNIILVWFDYGWFWFIPLSDGTTSVGAVCWPEYFKSRKTDMNQFFLDTIAMSPELSMRLKGATLTGAVTGTGNYSYRAETMVGKDFLMVGDAFAFIDPVFSTGVYLAMKGAFFAADTVTTCLHEPAKSERALRTFDRHIRRALDLYSWYIYRVTAPALRDLLMTPRNVFRVEEAVLSLLAGDIYGVSPIAPRLLIFKTIYYLKALGQLKRSLTAWRKHKRDISVTIGEAV